MLSFNSYIEGGVRLPDVEYLEWMLMTKHGPSVAVIHIRKVSGPGADMHGTRMPGFQREPPKLLKVNLIELYILNALVNIHRHRDTVSAHRKREGRPSKKVECYLLYKIKKKSTGEVRPNSEALIHPFHSWHIYILYIRSPKPKVDGKCAALAAK